MSGFNRWLYSDRYRDMEPWPLWFRVFLITLIVLLALAKWLGWI
jgi:hypothetical protein